MPVLRERLGFFREPASLLWGMHSPYRSFDERWLPLGTIVKERHAKRAFDVYTSGPAKRSITDSDCVHSGPTITSIRRIPSLKDQKWNLPFDMASAKGMKSLISSS
jgi:hypothetical protein